MGRLERCAEYTMRHRGFTLIYRRGGRTKGVGTIDTLSFEMKFSSSAKSPHLCIYKSRIEIIWLSLSPAFNMSDASVTQEAPTLTVPSDPEQEGFTIYDVEKRYSRKGGIQCRVTLGPDSSQDGGLLNPDKQYRMMGAKAMDREASSRDFGISKDVDQLVGAYEGVPVKARDCKVFKGTTADQRVEAFLFHQDDAGGAFLHDVVFTVLDKESAKQSVSVARDWLSEEDGIKVASAGWFLLEASFLGMELPIYMSQSEERALPVYIEHSGSARPKNKNEVMFLSPSSRSESCKEGDQVFTGILEWSEPANGDDASPTEFRCGTESSFCLLDSMMSLST